MELKSDPHKSMSASYDMHTTVRNVARQAQGVLMPGAPRAPLRRLVRKRRDGSLQTLGLDVPICCLFDDEGALPKSRAFVLIDGDPEKVTPYVTCDWDESKMLPLTARDLHPPFATFERDVRAALGCQSRPINIVRMDSDGSEGPAVRTNTQLADALKAGVRLFKAVDTSVAVRASSSSTQKPVSA